MKIATMIKAKTATAANVQAGGAAFLASMTWIVEAEPYFIAVATLAAAVASVAAAWYHIERARYYRRKRGEDAGPDTE